MTPEEMAAVASKTDSNAEEIQRLRERSHDFGNELQKAIAGIDNLSGKLDAIHTSTLGRIAELRGETKEDLTEIKIQTTATNGKVAEHSGQISRIQGAGAVIVVLIPVALFLAPHIH